jgi:hypothetical protein
MSAFGVKIHELVSKLEVNNVFLKDNLLQVHAHPYLIRPEKTDVKIDEGVVWKLSADKKILFCEITRKLEANSKLEQDTDAKKSLVLDVTFIVQYVSSVPLDEIDLNLVQVFCETNGTYNSHTYYREFVHSMCNRVGMYPIVIPFMRPFTMKQIQMRYEQLTGKSCEEIAP